MSFWGAVSRSEFQKLPTFWYRNTAPFHFVATWRLEIHFLELRHSNNGKSKLSSALHCKITGRIRLGSFRQQYFTVWLVVFSQAKQISDGLELSLTCVTAVWLKVLTTLDGGVSQPIWCFSSILHLQRSPFGVNLVLLGGRGVVDG